MLPARPAPRPAHTSSRSSTPDTGAQCLRRRARRTARKEIGCDGVSGGMDTALALADRSDTFFRVDTFAVKASVRVWLDRLDVDELGEVLADSWRARRGVRG